jgi:drug/metabolite transporter (DMT)-like permease
MNSTLSAPLTGVSPADIQPVSPPPHAGRRAGVLEDPSFLPGVAVGLVAASIGALYTVFARWGVAHGLAAQDMTVLRFGVAGLVMLPVLWLALRRDAAGLFARWRVWLAVSLLAGPPFGLLMFGALQWAPASHAAVFPFTAMSVMGTLMAAAFLGDRITVRKAVGIAVVVTGLVVLSGLSLSSMTPRALLGDLMFIAAGTLWAGFGIVSRKHRLAPLLATAVISVFALLTYVPAYFALVGADRLLAAAPQVLAVEVLVQGLIAGAGTLYTYSRMVALLGPARAAVFPALAPGIAALMAWPVLGHVPTGVELLGMLLAMAGLVITVTTARKRSSSPR